MAPIGISVGVGVAFSFLHNRLWTSGWVLTKLWWIFNWDITKNWLDFGDLDLIFTTTTWPKNTRVEKLKIHGRGTFLFSENTVTSCYCFTKNPVFAANNVDPIRWCVFLWKYAECFKMYETCCMKHVFHHHWNSKLWTVWSGHLLCTTNIYCPVVQSIISLSSSLVVRMLTALVSTVSSSQLLLLKKCG